LPPLVPPQAAQGVQPSFVAGSHPRRRPSWRRRPARVRPAAQDCGAGERMPSGRFFRSAAPPVPRAPPASHRRRSWPASCGRRGGTSVFQSMGGPVDLTHALVGPPPWPLAAGGCLPNLPPIKRPSGLVQQPRPPAFGQGPATNSSGRTRVPGFRVFCGRGGPPRTIVPRSSARAEQHPWWGTVWTTFTPSRPSISGLPGSR